MATRILTSKETIKSFQRVIHSGASSYKAMYNSSIDGIITDPSLMCVPLDDHMVHRGHSVFDTLTVANGRAIHIDRHMARFTNSATGAHISLPMSVEQMKEKLL